MYCKNCGAENEDSMKFCVNCGMEISSNDTDLPDKSISETTQNTVTNTVPHKMSKKTKCIVIIIAVILLLIAVVYKICSGLMSPERLVTKYINAQAAGNYSELYGMLDIPDGEFTTKSQFVDTLERSAEDAEQVSVKNINVTEASATDLSNTSKYYFTKAYDKAYRVTYSNQEQKTVFLSMQKGMLFDKYKVLPTEYLIEYYTVCMPPYANAAFDGIQLSDSNTKKRTVNNKTEYKLNNLFNGKHNITVSAPFAEETDVTAEADLSDDKIDCNNYLKVRQDVKEEMQKLAEEALKTVYDATTANKDFSEIVSQLKIASGQEKVVENGYKRFADRFNNTSYTHANLTFKGIKPPTEDSRGITDNLDAPLRYSVKFEVSYDIVEKSGFIYIGEHHQEDTQSLSVDFSYENNELKIYAINDVYYK